MAEREAKQSEAALLRVSPPRSGEYTLQTFVNVLESLGDGHVFALEIASVGSRTELFVRTYYPKDVEQHLESHYAGIEIDVVPPEEDPIRAREGEKAMRRALRPEGDEWLPFKVYDDSDSLERADPFIDVLGSMSGHNLRGGERVVSRVILRQQPHDWSEEWRARGMSGAGSENQAAMDEQRREERKRDSSYRGRGGDRDRRRRSDEPPFGVDIAIYCAIIAPVAIGAWYIYRFFQSGQWLELAGVIGLAMLAALIVGGIIWKMGFFKRSSKDVYHDPEQVRVRISGGAYKVEVQLLAFVAESKADGGCENARSRGGKMLEGVVGAYRGFDNPLGCRFAVNPMENVRAAGSHEEETGEEIEGNELIFSDEARKRGLLGFGGGVSGVVGSREVAAFWHIPSQSAEVSALARLQSKRLEPAREATNGGALIGVSGVQGGDESDVYFPEDVMRRHHMYVARTRMGKSTLMGHVGSDRMVEKAEGRCPDALVVVDPHSDLVRELLSRCPAELADDICLMDMGGAERSVGVNLIDTDVFPDRDAAAACLISVAQGTWENWGNRMETILVNVIKAMYEYNLSVGRRKQLTFLDTGAMLSNEEFRNKVLQKVQDPFILEWWQEAYGGWSKEYGQDAIAPVLTRMANYMGSKAVRSILGQPMCTLNMREAIEDGKVLLVNTNQSTVGAEVASLVGASVLKLVDTIVRQQGQTRDIADRRKVMLVVDEMQSMGGVDFQSILSEVGKFGGSMVLATQSLSRLNEQSPTMTDSILSNIGALVSYQVNAVDAERLLPELRSEYLEDEDITGLPVHNAYVRITSDGGVQAPFSMQVLRPPGGVDMVERSVEEGTAHYSRPTEDVLRELDETMNSRVEGFREKIEREGKVDEKDAAGVHMPIDLGHQNKRKGGAKGGARGGAKGGAKGKGAKAPAGAVA